MRIIVDVMGGDNAPDAIALGAIEAAKEEWKVDIYLEPGENAVTVRLGGPTCLSGDVIGDYSFQKPLAYGDLLMFGDMAIYTTCKNNTFNGMPLPDIWLRHGDKTMERLTDFGYEDFKGRLGHRRKSE